jgi:GPI mannosyltransferase 3
LTRQERSLFALIFFIAISARFTASLPFAQLHNDEIGQYMEQAHRLVFGYGITPWEYRVEMRSWLMPALLSGPMAIGNGLAPDSMAYLIAPRLLMACCSLSILWAGWRLGRAISPDHGWMAMSVAAIWFEFIQFGARTLTEPLATAAILPAAAILLVGDASRRQIVVAGALLALGCIFRFHYGPAVVVLALAGLWGRWDRFLPLAMGGLAMAALSSVVDLAMGQMPFQWIITNVQYNIVHDVASEFGVTPFYGYLTNQMAEWGWSFIPIVALSVLGIRHYPVLFAAAIVNLLLHSLIGHKEYRFIFLTSTILILLAALASVDLAKRWMPKGPQWVLYLALPFWLVASVSLGGTDHRRTIWTKLEPTMALVHHAGKLPATCGFAFDHRYFWSSGAYVALHKNVPFYMERSLDPALLRSGKPLRAPQAYNSIVGPEALKQLLPKGYAVMECRPVGEEANFSTFEGSAKVCLFHRPGPCEAKGTEKWQAQAVLRQIGR